MPLKKISKYEVIGELGKGAMGVVYKAQDPFLGRPVAIKTMSEMLCDNKDLVQRFYREAQAAGKLRHPNIVTIYDMGEEGGMPFIAMELIEGQDLDEIISARLPYPLIKKLNIVSQICKGLDYAHESGIIHRDIKPANIRILPDGKSVKIMDFGIARMTDSNMTRPGMVMGTVSYMSPEQITAPQAIDRRSDLFSVGVILYEFLTCRLPFSGDSIHAILTNIVHQPITPIKTLLPACPTGLEVLLDRSLAKNRDERFATCSEMGREIDSLVEMMKPQAIKELLQTGQYELEQNNLIAARQHYEDVISIQSTHDLARTYLKQIEDRQKKPLQATHLPTGTTSATIMPGSFAPTPPASQAAAPAPGGASFCPSCGSRLPAGTRFCSQCGSSVSTPTVSTPTVSTPTVSRPAPPPPPAPAPPAPAVSAPIPEIVAPPRTVAARPASRAPLYLMAVLILAGVAGGGYYFLFLRNPVTPPVRETKTTESPSATIAPPSTLAPEVSRPGEPPSPPTTLQVAGGAGSASGSTSGRGPSGKTPPPVVPESRGKTTAASPAGTTAVHAESTEGRKPQVIEVASNANSQPIGGNSFTRNPKQEAKLTESPVESTVIESPPETIVQRPSPPTTAAEVVEQEKPSRPSGPPPYTGPRAGIIEWNGEVQKGEVVILEGSSSNSGTVRGQLPGVPCLVDLTGEKVAITESPGISNQWKRLGLRFDKKGKARVTIRWQVLPHVR